MNFLEKLRAYKIGRNPKGCTPEEIAALEREYGVVFPDDYRVFLEMCGKGVDDFVSGSSIFVQQLDSVLESANELLTDAGLDPLPPGDYVFYMHQGYVFFFFHEGAVYYFMEGDKAIEKRYDSFEEFFDVFCEL